MSCSKRTPEALLVAVLLAPIAGCERATDFGPGVAARIGGRDVPYSAFESYVVKATGEQSGGLDSAVLSSLFAQFLEQELLLRLAIERKLINGEGRASEAARRLLEEQPAPALSEGGVAAYYRDHRSEFQRDERVRLRQVLLQDLETAERVRAELAAGVAFEEVARRFSTDQTAVFVGERGELQRSQLPVCSSSRSLLSATVRPARC